MLELKKEFKTNMLAQINPEFILKYTGERALKEDAKEKLTVTIDGVTYDADMTAISYMTSIVSLANFNVIKMVAYDGVAMDEAFNAVFVNTTIEWKCADNVIRTTPIATIANVLNQAMLQIADVVGVTDNAALD